MWHWTTALVVLGLLGTVLLRKTFLSYKTNAAIIQNALADAGTSISIDLAKSIGRALRAPMWQWHHYLGLALATLVVARVVLWMVQHDDHAFRRLRRRFGPSRSKAPEDRPTKRQVAGAVFHGLFYVGLLLIVSSGLALYFRGTIGLSGSGYQSVKELHEVLTVLFVAYVPIHLAGIVRAELRDEPGIASKMIHGGRR